MVTHVVLYRPRPGLDDEAAGRFTAALAAARREIPGILRFIVGRRLDPGPAYSLGPFPDFPFLAVVEFASREDLLGYLQHPRHVELGRSFAECAEAALVYDFETADAAEAAFLLR